MVVCFYTSFNNEFLFQTFYSQQFSFRCIGFDVVLASYGRSFIGRCWSRFIRNFKHAPRGTRLRTPIYTSENRYIFILACFSSIRFTRETGAWILFSNNEISGSMMLDMDFKTYHRASRTWHKDYLRWNNGQFFQNFYLTWKFSYSWSYSKNRHSIYEA